MRVHALLLLEGLRRRIRNSDNIFLKIRSRYSGTTWHSSIIKCESNEGHNMQIEAKNKTLINRRKLLAIIPLSERTIFNMEQRGEFPRRIVLTSRNVAWDLAEIEEWIESRKSSSDQPIRPGFTPPAVAA
jgi:prophage regulatory protein